MNHLIPYDRNAEMDSAWFEELERLSDPNSLELGANDRIEEIFKQHSDNLISDLIIHPEHRKNYLKIGANLRQKESLRQDKSFKTFQPSLGFVQKVARLLKDHDIEGLEKAVRQIELDSSSNFRMSSVLLKLPNLKLPANIEEIRAISHPGIRFHLMATIINRDKLAIQNLGLTKRELMQIGPHLTYLNCYNAFDDSWNRDEIHSFLDTCLDLETLKINSHKITRLPSLPRCKELDCSQCNHFAELLGNLNQERRFEIAKVAAAQNRRAFAEHIADYALSQDQRFEIARIIASKSGEDVSEFIRNFNLTESQRFEIAMIAAGTDGGVSEYIANYEIRDQAQLFEIAKISANSFYCWRISRYIENYNLTESQRFEVAKTAAMRDGRAISERIAKYDLTDPTMRFEIAKIAVTSNSDTSRFISKYNLTENQRFELAKIAAAKSGLEITKNLGDYAIADQDMRFEIAKVAAAENGNAVSEFIQNYNLTEDQRFETAKVAVTHYFLYGVAKFIRNYNLNERQRYEIVKIAAAREGGRASMYIANFEIMDQDMRFEVAKIAVARDGFGVMGLIDNYNIMNRAMRLEITKIAAAENGLVYHMIDKYNLNLTEKERFEVFQIAARQVSALQDITTLQRLLKEYGEREGEVALIQFPGLSLLTERELTNDEIANSLKVSPFYEKISPILDEIYQQESVFTKKPLTQCLGLFLLVCQLQNILPENMEKGLPIIQELFAFRSPSFRLTLINHVVETLKTEEGIESWEKMFKLTENKSFTALICLFLDPLVSEKNKEAVADVIKTRVPFQNTGQRNPFIKSLERLFTEKRYSLSDKQLVLSKFILQLPITPASLIRNAQRVAFLLEFREAEALKIADPIHGIEDIIKNRVLHDKLNLSSIENCVEKFLNTFGSVPEPDMLLRYAATLMKLRDRDTRELYMKHLREFAAAVLTGDFPEMRYTTDNNVHLKKIFEKVQDQRLKEKWKRGAVYDDIFTPRVAYEIKEIVFEAVDFFKAKILHEGHLKASDYPELFRILKDPSKLEKTKVQLENKLKGKATSPEDIQNRKISSFQLQLIKLMYPDNPLSNLELKGKMENLVEVLRKISAKAEPPLLGQDIAEVIRSLSAPLVKRQPSKYDGFVVKDTDDPNILLRVGNLSGSCQNVSDDPNLCKCLLSYLLDGKNRALIIEDREGKIVARVMLRLLWDPSDKRVVLFQDGTYPTTGLDGAMQKALNEACKRRAAELNLPLLSATQTDSPYPNSVSSLGGRAPSEYVDAGPGNTGNVWILENMYYVV